MARLQRYLLLLIASAVAASLTVGFELAARLAEHGYASLLGASTFAISITPLGLALVAFAARTSFGVTGSGVPEIVAAQSTGKASQRCVWASMRDAIARAGLTLAALLCGASVGRQGPSVSLAAALVHSVSLRSGDAPALSRMALQMGAAAGVAAAYNAPIAGCLFALEQLRPAWTFRIAWVAASAALAGLVASALAGTTPHFASTRIAEVDVGAWLPLLEVTALAGICGSLFAAAVVRLPGLFPSFRARHAVVCALLGGTLIAALSIASHDPVYGTGEAEIAGMTDHLVSAAYPMAKALATLLSFWIGLAGGLFGPSIAIGAGIGAAMAHLFTGVPAAVLVLSGMAAFLAAATRTPLTAGIFAVEASGQYLLAPALLAGALLGHWISTATLGVTIYSTPALGLIRKSSETHDRG